MFEWKIFARHATLKLLWAVQNMMEKDHIQPESFKDRIIFMSMYNDIDWNQKEMKSFVNVIIHSLPKMPKNFPKDRGRSSDLDQKQNDVLRSPINQFVLGTRSPKK